MLQHNYYIYAKRNFSWTGRFTMGQNLALIWSTIPLADDDGDFPSRIKNWFDEVKKYAFGGQWSVQTGHYSQVNMANDFIF